MRRQPSLKMQAILKSPAKGRHHRFVDRRIELCVVSNAFQEPAKPFTKVTRSEIGQPGVR